MPSDVAEALEQSLRTLQREQQALNAEVEVARAARAQAESMLAVLAEWSFFIEGAAHDRMRLLREAPRLLVPRLAEAATVEIARFGSRPWAVAHIDPARAAALERGDARPRTDGDAGVQRVPLMDGGRNLGWLTVWWERPQPVSPATSMILSLLAQQMAAVLAESERQTGRQQIDRASASLATLIAQELTDPLQAVGLSLEMVTAARAQSDHADGILDQRITAMRRASVRMQRGLELVLATDAIRRDALTLSPERLDLVEVTRRVAASVTLEMEDLGVPCVVHDAPALQGSWDRVGLEVVLGVLLRHASRTAPGAQVEVRILADRAARVIIGQSEGRSDGAQGGEVIDPAASSSVRAAERDGLALWVARELLAALRGTLVTSSAAWVMELPLTS